ncbi:putative CMP-sialic acid transporter 5 [Cocos nucifera]|uniref:Putative CMP-sialic acid transporter 5 n=1 Tax=Cocos nucifera TaxID=13894 RepID=A0A8K0MVM4_COCNU|nr:putative CMP-sialic acid transporter 5 [Cocos nucifera]
MNEMFDANEVCFELKQHIQEASMPKLDHDLGSRNNVLLAIPALLYAINNYLKFIMQLYFNPATVKMLSNLKWEALALLLIGISVNQLRSLPQGTTALDLPVAMVAYIYTLIFVTVPSLASVYNEYALKSQFETSIYLQNLFLYGYGATFNFIAIIGTAIFKGPSSFDILQGHSRATMLLICNNAAQGILSSFFFKYADTILKKYSSTVATIFTGIASALLFGHTLTINFMLGISIVFISMHQFFSPLAKAKNEVPNGTMEMKDAQDLRLLNLIAVVDRLPDAILCSLVMSQFILYFQPFEVACSTRSTDIFLISDTSKYLWGCSGYSPPLRSKEASFINMTAGATEDASHRIGPDEKQPLLPT